MIRFGSVCSGIEAASVAWQPLGWKAAWLSEIEPFPSAVLAHHYPDVPNLGDMTTLPTRIQAGEVEAPDVFCGGTPCQAFSVAGLRKSLDDVRGNLSLTFCEIANAIDTVRADRGDQPAIIFWENVPGVLSTKDNAFGCFLAGLAGEVEPLEPPGGKWTNAGYVSGPQRAVAWRILDAQYFGLAQRRRRVFIVASARDDFDPAAVLFEFDGVRRDSAPRREAGQTTARGAGAGAAVGFQSSQSGVRLVETHATLDANNGSRRHNGVLTMAHGQGGAEIARDRSPTLTCNHEAPICFHPTQDPISSVDGTTHAMGCGSSSGQASIAVAFAENSHAGCPLFVPSATGVKYAYYSHDYAHDRITDTSGVNPSLTREAHASGNLNIAQPIAYTTKLHNTGSNNAGKIFEERTTCLDANSPPPVVFQPTGAFFAGQGAKAGSIAYSEDVAPTLKASDSGTNRTPSAHIGMLVRRLTPEECEALQGFPRRHTAIPWRKKSADQCPDGPRYKALGNSWAVPVVRWIGQRIDQAINLNQIRST
ncbi:MAG: DNA cytosine methyltransferase [Macromonas sp.]